MTRPERGLPRRSLTAERDQELFELRAGADVSIEAQQMLVQNGRPARPRKVGSISARHRFRSRNRPGSMSWSD